MMCQYHMIVLVWGLPETLLGGSLRATPKIHFRRTH